MKNCKISILTVKRIIENEKPVLEGTGDQTRDYTYVTDTAKGFIKAYECKESRGKIINLGSGIETPIKEIVLGICDYFDYKGDIDYIPERKTDAKRHCADISKARKILDFKPEVPFGQGIQKTLNWYSSTKG